MTSEAASPALPQPRARGSSAIFVLGYLLAVLMPLAGVLVGAVAFTRHTRRATLHGALIIVTSVAVLAAGAALLPAIVDSSLTGARQRAEHELREVAAQTQHEEQAADRKYAEQIARSSAEEHETLARLRRDQQQSSAAGVGSGR